jgi:hypothetical protein
MDKRKDNLTDIVGRLSDSQEGSQDTRNDGQIFSPDGELVTLSREEIARIVQTAVKEQIEPIGKIVVAEVEKKLREKGLS